MPRDLFTSAQFVAGARRSAWDAALTSFAINAQLLDEGRDRDGRFFAVMDSYVSVRGLKFSLLESESQVLSPTPGLTGGVFWLSLILEGDAVLEMEGETTALSKGDMVCGKRGAAGSLALLSRFRMLNVAIPAEMIARSVLVPLPDRVMSPKRDAGLNRVLSGMLSVVGDSIDCLRDERVFAIEDMIIRLLAGCLFDDTGEVLLGGMASSRAGLLRRVWRSIEERLGDPAISIGQIAESHKLSVRYLQLLFEDHGSTFSAYVRRRRLENCRSAMADPVNANVSITSICMHWGFAESASFSRAFREEYGESPRQFRQRFASGEPRKGRRQLAGLTLS